MRGKGAMQKQKFLCHPKSLLETKGHIGREEFQTLKTGACISSILIYCVSCSFNGPKSCALKTGERAASTNL